MDENTARDGQRKQEAVEHSETGNAMYQQPHGPEKRHNTSPPDFFCGWCAGCVETCVLFPLSKMTFRQQLYGIVLKDAIAQLFSEGVAKLYRGLLPPLIQRTSSRMVMFGMFDTYQRLLGCASCSSSFTICHAVAAMLAGTTEGLLCPLERVQVLLQTSAYHSAFRNTGEAFRVVCRHGVPELYRGISLVIVRNSLSNSLFFTLREPLGELVLRQLTAVSAYLKLTKLHTVNDDEVSEHGRAEEDLHSAGAQKFSFSTADVRHTAEMHPVFLHVSNFVSGAFLGAAISTLFFPLNVVKHRLQSVFGVPFESAAKVFRIVWRERNGSLRELYRGVHLNYTRSLMTWGLTNSVYEYLKSFFETVS